MIEAFSRKAYHMLVNVRQATIQAIIEATVTAGALIHTDEYAIYARLTTWGYRHKTVCHRRGEYARDEEAMASAKSTSIPSKASGRCCAPGSVRTAVSRRRSCPSISDSSSSSTTLGDAERLCSTLSSLLCSHDPPVTTLKSVKSQG
jgi:hypothetical protein